MHAQLWKNGDYPAATASLNREHHILDSHWESMPDQNNFDPTQVQAKIEVMSVLLASHFWNEEQLMHSVGFPGYLDHKAEHGWISDAFEVFLTNIPTSAPRCLQALGFLRQYATNHRLIQDKEFDKFIKHSGATSRLGI